MKIAVAATNESFDSPVSDRFGRCPFFLIIDTDSMEFEKVENSAMDMPGGAGPAAARLVADQNVQAVFAGNYGPKASQALEVAGIKAIEASGSIQEAIDSWKHLQAQ